MRRWLSSAAAWPRAVRTGPSPKAREASLAIEADSSTLAARADRFSGAGGGDRGRWHGAVEPRGGERRANSSAAGTNGSRSRWSSRGAWRRFRPRSTGWNEVARLVIVDDLAIRPVEEGAGDTQSPLLTETLTLSAFWSRPRS